MSTRDRINVEPYTVLTFDEMCRLADWRCRFGVIHYTREVADTNARRVLTIGIPLVEEVDRQVVCGLIFWRMRAAQRIGADQ